MKVEDLSGGTVVEDEVSLFEPAGAAPVAAASFASSVTTSSENAPIVLGPSPSGPSGGPRLVVVHGPAPPGGVAVPLGTPANDAPHPVGVSLGLGTEIDVSPATGDRRFEVICRRAGTRLNGRPFEREVLTPGDVIRTSHHLMVFVDGDPMDEALRRMRRVAPSRLSVLITGETGTGKEVLAQALHALSGRAGAFNAVNCAAIPRELFATELFGHQRGAFSGAVRRRTGWIAASRGGTLLLDEVGDLPLELQAALLRVVETKMVAPLGTEEERYVDVRIVAATNRDLGDAVRDGRFRGDLHARLAQVTIQVPPLRRRRCHVLRLAAEIAAEHHFTLSLGADAAEALLLHDWPYNVRELKSLVAGLSLFAGDGPHVTREHLLEVQPTFGVSRASPAPPPRERGTMNGPPAPRGSSAAVLRDRRLLGVELERAQGNIAAVARALGTSRSHVYRWVSRWGLTRV